MRRRAQRRHECARGPRSRDVPSRRPGARHVRPARDVEADADRDPVRRRRASASRSRMPASLPAARVEVVRPLDHDGLLAQAASSAARRWPGRRATTARRAPRRRPVARSASARAGAGLPMPTLAPCRPRPAVCSSASTSVPGRRAGARHAHARRRAWTRRRRRARHAEAPSTPRQLRRRRRRRSACRRTISGRRQVEHDGEHDRYQPNDAKLRRLM